jgi:hypothetical protein
MPVKAKKKLDEILEELDMPSTLLSLEVSSCARKLLETKKMKLDVGGHFRTGGGRKMEAHTVKYLVGQVGEITFGKYSAKAAKHVLKVAEGKAKPGPWITLRNSNLFQCSECSEAVHLEFDGKKMRCANPCKYPKGLPPYDIELNIPSGKMVVANDLRDHWRITGDYNVNLTANCKKTTEKYAEVGMAHAFISNTCAGVYKVNDKKFEIGCGLKKRKRVGGICTDLWWYSIVDYDDFVKRVGDPKKANMMIDVVKCKPGVYRFRHQFHLTYETKNELFTKIDWVRNPDPVKDYKADYAALNFTAGQIVANSVERWRSYDSKKKSKASFVQRAVDHIMCTLGSGYEYHPNGWLGEDPDLKTDAPEIRIPVFMKKYNWYPLSDHSFIVRAAGVGKDFGFEDAKMEDIKLNDSFLRLAFNVLHCIAKYGVEEHSGRKHAKTTIMYAKKALKGLVKKYETKVPKYVKDYFESSNA